MNKGLFIVFEGVDACGKSTQIKNLQKYIDEEYYYLFNRVSIGCEPTDKESGKFIRRVLSKEINIENIDVISGMFLSDRALHQEEILESIDLLNDVYICDRYIYSNSGKSAISAEKNMTTLVFDVSQYKGKYLKINYFTSNIGINSERFGFIEDISIGYKSQNCKMYNNYGAIIPAYTILTINITSSIGS